jgi:hypothetical protein
VALPLAFSASSALSVSLPTGASSTNNPLAGPVVPVVTSAGSEQVVSGLP